MLICTPSLLLFYDSLSPLYEFYILQDTPLRLSLSSSNRSYDIFFILKHIRWYDLFDVSVEVMQRKKCNKCEQIEIALYHNV